MSSQELKRPRPDTSVSIQHDGVSVLKIVLLQGVPTLDQWLGCKPETMEYEWFVWFRPTCRAMDRFIREVLLCRVVCVVNYTYEGFYPKSQYSRCWFPRPIVVLLYPNLVLCEMRWTHVPCTVSLTYVGAVDTSETSVAVDIDIHRGADVLVNVIMEAPRFYPHEYAMRDSWLAVGTTTYKDNVLTVYAKHFDLNRDACTRCLKLLEACTCDQD